MTDGEVASAIKHALELHQANRLAEAEPIYRQILAQRPHQSDALHLLGSLFGQTGRQEAGLELIRKACAIQPNFAPYHNNLGMVLGALHRQDQAIQAYQAALRIDPKLDLAWSNLGVAYIELGRFAEAIPPLRKAVELNPRSSIAWDNLGIALRETNDLAGSRQAHERAIALQPAAFLAHSHLGITLRMLGDLAGAEQACRASLAICPNPDAFNNLGLALSQRGETEAAIAAFGKALALRPRFGGALTNLGNALADAGRYAKALAACQAAVEAEPQMARAHYNLALVQLVSGNFSAGWLEYEWRWKTPGYQLPRDVKQARWEGQEPAGKTVLLHAEQGLGDTIQFCRYASLLKARGARVILACDGALRRLMKGMDAVAEVIAFGQSLPPFDAYLPMLSAPRVFQTELGSIPATTPYLSPPPAAVEEWAARLGPPGDTPRVGLVWAGGPRHARDRERSIPLSSFAALADLPATFFSLQKGNGAEQAAASPLPRWVDVTDELFDMADTAALIANLDLVITVDTAVAHLAGAMGRPVWTLVQFNPDWRWLLDRDDSPWYPTMRLFRQTSPGDWPEVTRRVRTCLAEEGRKLADR